MPTTIQLIGIGIAVTLVVVGIVMSMNTPSTSTGTPVPTIVSGAVTPGVPVVPVVPVSKIDPVKVANTALLQQYTLQLNQATAAITQRPMLTNTFGTVGRFYVSGQAASPDLSQLKFISETTGYSTINDYVKNAPTDASVLIYDATTQKCKYYSGLASLSNLKAGTLTVGTTIL
jgi:hypothetical protein